MVHGSQAPVTEPRRLLLIEDNPGDAALIVELLANTGARQDHVDTVTTLGDALARINRAEYDVLLLDLRLPDATGAESVAAIRAVIEDVPIVVLTGWDDDTMATACLRAGAQDYVSKQDLRERSLQRAIGYAVARTAERSQRKRADALQARLAAIIEGSSDAIVSFDLDGVITSWNPSAEQTFGLSSAAALGRPTREIVPFLRELAPPFTGGSQPLGDAPVAPSERVWVTPQGGAVTLSVVANPLRVGRKTLGYAAICRDITAQKSLEIQLALSDRMVSIGSLAAGVAHEINNPLTAVSANLELASASLGRLGSTDASLDDVANELRDAIEATERVRKIVHDLKIFSRAEEETRRSVAVRGVVESTLRLAANEIRHRARLVVEHGDAPTVLVNEARLGQVLLNLVMNAAQSIAEGNHDGNEIRVTTGTTPDGSATIAVADTGAGMSKEVQQKLFHAFFTTKPIGVGTGLGLAISQRIVTSFGGRISFESELGRGSRFVVTLPAASGPPDVAAEASDTAAAPARRGKILIIDDEPSLHRVFRRILGPEHDVTATDSAEEALGLLIRGYQYDVILCDLMMPQMSGAEFLRSLERMGQGQAARVTFMTGGAFTPTAREFLDRVPNRVLEKPFTREQLCALMKELLG